DRGLALVEGVAVELPDDPPGLPVRAEAGREGCGLAVYVDHVELGTPEVRALDADVDLSLATVDVEGNVVAQEIGKGVLRACTEVPDFRAIPLFRGCAHECEGLRIDFAT